jgi:mRNA-degrading endonuclease toxin of MazEF toxin-antitoxin module
VPQATAIGEAWYARVSNRCLQASLVVEDPEALARNIRMRLLPREEGLRIDKVAVGERRLENAALWATGEGEGVVTLREAGCDTTSMTFAIKATQRRRLYSTSILWRPNVQEGVHDSSCCGGKEDVASIRWLAPGTRKRNLRGAYVTHTPWPLGTHILPNRSC